MTEGQPPVLSRVHLAKLLSASMGREKAEECISEAAASLGLGGTFGHDDALRVLEAVATQPGIVGITARFAKSRLLLRGA
jgi:hypothetical protein